MKKIMVIVLGVMALTMASFSTGYAHGYHVPAGGSVWIGPGWGAAWGPGWGPAWGFGWGPGLVVPVFPRYYPSYPPPAMSVQPPAVEYFDAAPQPEDQEYWYYCKQTRAYYPYVKACPGGWTKMTPYTEKRKKEE